MIVMHIIFPTLRQVKRHQFNSTHETGASPVINKSISVLFRLSSPRVVVCCAPMISVVWCEPIIKVNPGCFNFHPFGFQWFHIKHINKVELMSICLSNMYKLHKKFTIMQNDKQSEGRFMFSYKQHTFKVI